MVSFKDVETDRGFRRRAVRSGLFFFEVLFDLTLTHNQSQEKAHSKIRYILIPLLTWPLKFDSVACLLDGICLVVLITDVFFDLNTVPFKENQEGRCQRSIRFFKSLIIGEDTHNILAVRKLFYY